MERIVFATYSDDNCFERFGGKKLEASLNHFHPEIPFIRFKSSDIYQEFDNPDHYGKVDWRNIKPVLGLKLCEEYENIIMLDCDSIVIAPLDELFSEDYDIAGCRNNNDYGRAGGRNGFKVGNVSIYDYMNAGLVSIRSERFWKEWYEFNIKNDVCSWGLGEQDSMNIIAYSGVYKCKLLDPVGGDSYYGIANTWANECESNAETNHWDSWKTFIRESDGLYLVSPKTGKKCKNFALHHAGGGYERLTKEYFNDEAWYYIEEITK